MLSPEDVGVDIKSGYEYLKLYKADNSDINRALQESIATQEIYKNLRTSDEPGKSTPEECYRDLYVKLSEMDVQK